MNEKIPRKDIINALLLSFKVTFYDFEEVNGTTVTLYKFRPQIGVRVSRIRSLKDDLAVALGVSSVRIIAPMEDGSVGIEVPNNEKKILPMSYIFNSCEYKNTDAILPCAIGRTVTNEVFMADLALMPHLLVAGATGQGKSVGLNMIIMSLLLRKSPDELKLMLIDPKQVEFGIYSRLEGSYLACPVITEPDEAEQKLASVCNIMDERYSLISSRGVRNIQEYNELSNVSPLPYLVIVIDEYGDLIMTSGRELERTICRIAQKARAVGIHLIVSTQRPDTKVVTGNIKANFPTRIAFRTTTGIDSRVIIDQLGAEKLAGRGDMIFFNGSDTTRIQCAYVSNGDVTATCNLLSYKYSDYHNTMLVKEPEKVIALSHPIYPRLMEVALKIAEYNKSVDADFIRYSLGGSYYTPYREIFDQLIELGILSLRSPRNGFSSEVLIHDKAEISRLISQYS